MIEMSVAEVARATRGRVVGDPDGRVSGPVVIDSRLAAPGALFAALPGEHVDGHDFALRAARAGASAILGTRPVADLPADVACVVVEDVQLALGELAAHVLEVLRREAAGLRVVGITGSVGKTTTKDLVGQVLAAQAPTVASEGSFNNELGLPLTVLRADRSTRHLVLEMGASGPGHLAYLGRIAPLDVAVVLAVGSAHLSGFGGIEAVARAKAEILEGLVPGGVGILNADDPRVAAMAAGTASRTATFGTVTGAGVRAAGVDVDREGRVSFDLVQGPATAGPRVRLGLVGEHHLGNALAAAAVALELGVPLERVAEALTFARALSPHRMQVTHRPDGVTVIDDAFNANPESMRAALKALAVMAGRERRSIAVLGEMLELGPDAREAHDAIGRLAVRLNISLVVVVGEGAGGILDGATQEGSWGEEAVLVEDLAAAEDLLRAELRPGDVVLVKSSHGAGLWRLGDVLSAGSGDAGSPPAPALVDAAPAPAPAEAGA